MIYEMAEYGRRWQKISDISGMSAIWGSCLGCHRIVLLFSVVFLEGDAWAIGRSVTEWRFFLRIGLFSVALGMARTRILGTPRRSLG